MSIEEKLNVFITEQEITIRRHEQYILLTIARPELSGNVVPLSLDEAQELRDMLTRALELEQSRYAHESGERSAPIQNAEDVKVVES